MKTISTFGGTYPIEGLRKPIIYYAGPIRAAEPIDIERNSFNMKMLQQYGIVLTEHVSDPKLAGIGELDKDTNFIRQRDYEWLAHSDVMFADVTRPSLGVGGEIEKAVQLYIPIIAAYNRSVNPKSLSAIVDGIRDWETKIKIIKYDRYNELEQLTKEFFSNLKLYPW